MHMECFWPCVHVCTYAYACVCTCNCVCLVFATCPYHPYFVCFAPYITLAGSCGRACLCTCMWLCMTLCVCVYDYVWVTVHVRTCVYFATPCHHILIYFAPVQEYGFIMWMGVYFSLFVCVRCIMLMGVWFSMFVCMCGCVLVLLCKHVGRTLDPKFFPNFLFPSIFSLCVNVAIPRLCGSANSIISTARLCLHVRVCVCLCVGVCVHLFRYPSSLRLP